uniref:Uncharacterized protein n=1 Tax=Rhizophora mucronata TaxID=61149 RepID=A0A2P2PL34_RHIMU
MLYISMRKWDNQFNFPKEDIMKLFTKTSLGTCSIVEDCCVSNSEISKFTSLKYCSC